MLAESYANHLNFGHNCRRYWVHPNILVGGSIINQDDWEHLKKDFGIGAVLNVEIEHFDREGKGIPPESILETVVPDDGTPFPLLLTLSALTWSEAKLKDGLKLYVHCQMGGSRSPAFAYAILRHVYGMSPADALLHVQCGQSGVATYGDHAYHKSYLQSVEDALIEV